MVLLYGCGSPAKHLMKVWQYQGRPNTDAPVQMSFDAYNNTRWWYMQADSAFFRYDTTKDTLWVMNSQGQKSYRIDKINKKQLVISTSLEGNFQRWKFEALRKIKQEEQLVPDQIPSLSVQGVEHTWDEIVPALHAPTVELRLKNLLLVFNDGDYITASTIRGLMGIPPLGVIEETEEIAMQRYIIGQFERITRQGDDFFATLKNGDINASLPIYTQENGQRILQTMLSLRIKKNAHASFQTDYKSIKMAVDGVKMGKGWFLLGMPPLQIEGDWGELLGIRFYIAR